MADLFTNSDTFGSNVFTPVTVTGPVQFTFSGVLGPLKKAPQLEIYAKTDSADAFPVHTQSGYGVFKLDFAPDTVYFYSYYPEGSTSDLSVVDA